MYALGWYNAFHTEVYVDCGEVHYTLNVLPLLAAESFYVCGVQRAPRLLLLTQSILSLPSSEALEAPTDKRGCDRRGQGEEGELLYASLTFTQSKSRALLSLV